MSSRQIQIRRGTAAQHTDFTGAIGEITMDTTNKTLRIHDGETAGGIALARRDEISDIITLPDNYDFIVATGGTSAAWWRKYKSGWCEQGGYGTPSTASSQYKIVFPIPMRDANYTLTAISKSSPSTSTTTPHGCHYINKSATECSIISLKGNTGDWISAEVNWHICGFAADD